MKFKDVVKEEGEAAVTTMQASDVAQFGDRIGSKKKKNPMTKKPLVDWTKNHMEIEGVNESLETPGKIRRFLKALNEAGERKGHKREEVLQVLKDVHLGSLLIASSETKELKDSISKIIKHNDEITNLTEKIVEESKNISKKLNI